MADLKDWRNGWQPADVAMIVIFFGLVYAVAIWSGVMERKDMKGKKHHKTGIDYFLGGRDMNWVLIGPSIAASNIGTDVLVALAGGVCSAGLGTISYEIGSGWSILCLGFFMGPMYLRSVLRTIPQYMELRYNQWCRITFVCFSTAVFILSKFGVNVYSGSLIFNTMITTPERQYSLWIFIPVLVVITAIYTVVGGLTSVMYADFVQLFLFMVTGYASVGYCLRSFGHTTAGIRGALNELGLNHLQHLIQPKDQPEYPWPATTIGMLVHEYYYWSTDQEMAQRVISAKGLGDARVGCAFGSMLKVASVWLAMIPGWTARIFYERCIRGDAGYELWCGPTALVGNYDMSDGGDANRAYPLLVMRNFPRGFKGLMIAGFLAAIMSNLSGAINSLATILTYDIYNRFFPPHYQIMHKYEREKRRQEMKKTFNPEKNPPPVMADHSQRHLVWMGRIFVVVCCAITILWQLGIQNLGSINLFSLTIIIQQHFGANIAATLLIGCVWRRSTQWGGLAGLLAGGIFAVIHAAFFLQNYAKCQSYIVHVPGNYSYVHYPNLRIYYICLHQTIATCIIWGITLAVNIIVSLPTPKPDYDKIEKYLIQWEDIIPRYVVFIQPSRAKPELDTGYIDAIRKEALAAQEMVDREIEAKRAGKKGAELEKELEGNKELVDPIVDEGFMNKEKQKQKVLMYIADPAAFCAFFFALFMFVYWR